MTNDELEALDLRARRESPDWLFARTLAIYGRTSDGYPRIYGSGILLQIADATFLVSAAHGLQKLENLEILLAPSGARSRFVPIGRTIVHMTEDQQDFDIAYARLADETVQALLDQGKRSVRLDSVDVVGATPGRYCVLGFPGECVTINNQTKRITSEPVMYDAALYDGKPLEPFTPGVSIALTYDENRIVRFNGERDRIPDLHCISGCGIWRLYAYRDARALPRWEPSLIRLAGIEHTLQGRPYKAVKGVVMGHVLYQIACTFPDLAASIRISWPAMPALVRPTVIPSALSSSAAP